MIVNLVYGISTMLLCLLLQAILFVRAIHYYHSKANLLDKPSFWSGMLVLNGIMLLLVIGNMLQIAIWAWLFMLLGEFQEFNEAFYHSAVNFATLGYGDVVMSAKHKLLGPLQAVNGVLMIGVSTAVLMSAFQDVIMKSLKARR